MAEMTLADALDSITSKLANTRKNGLADLKHIVRHNQNGSLARNLDNRAFHTIFETLFQCALDERSAMVKAKSQTTRTSAINRLTDTAAALRMSVEAGVHVLRIGTVRAVVEHVFHTMYQVSGDFCEPLALDYVKCVRALFRYQPHLEQLPPEFWEQCVTHCLDCVKKVEEDTVEDAEVASTFGSHFAISYRSSRSHVNASQDTRFAAKQLAEETVACLQLLTAVSNAPLQKKAYDIIWRLVEFVRTAGFTSRALPDAFAAINRVLSWSRTNNIALTQEVTNHLIRLIRQLWSPKSPSTTQMLVTLLLLRPYLFHAMNTSTALSLRTDLAGLLQVMQNDYAGRQERDSQKQLTLDDLRLEIRNNQKSEYGQIAVTLFSLRGVGLRGETNWLQVYMMASLYHVLMSSSARSEESDPERDHTITQSSSSRPRKRLRLQDEFSSLIESIGSDKASARTCALQILAFLVQQKSMSVDEMRKICDVVIITCGDDNANTASWAFLALTACMAQNVTAKADLTGRCVAFWQLATRSLSSAISCRAAGFALFVMLRLQLVTQAIITELAQSIAEAMDLNGPTHLSDAVSVLLRSLLNASRRLSPGTSSQMADSILIWLSRTFTPSKMDDRFYASSSASYEAVDVSNLMYECLGQRPHSRRETGFRVWDVAARAWLSCQDDNLLVSYLLLSTPDDPGWQPELEKISTLPPASVGLPPVSGEALLLTHLSNELTRINNTWTSSEQDRTRQISYDTYAMLCKSSCVFTCVSNCVELRDSRRQSQIQKQAATLFNALSQFMSATADDVKMDSYLTIVSSMFSRLTRHDENSPHEPSECEKLLCPVIADALTQRQASKTFTGDGDVMDLDDQFDSQDSGSIQAPTNNIELSNDVDVSFSKLALRSCSALYARVRATLDEVSSATQNINCASTLITNNLLLQSDAHLLACRDVIKIFPGLGLDLSMQDTERLLDYLMSKLTKKYAYARSEAVFGTILEILESQTPLWTISANGSLYSLGLDVYEWFTDVALRSGFLSPNVQKHLANLLRRLCDLDFEYPAHDGAISVSNNLFNLMQQGDIPLQFTLADRISTIFGRFVLSEHQKIFDDFLMKLPDDFQWVEGMAMRLLSLSKLGARWHSLLRHCVYYIFETAGRNKSSLDHATYCIAALSTELPLDSPQRLFSLFAPQLLLTWQGTKESLTKLPFTAFQYGSLAEILKANQSEVCAQLAIQGTDGDVDTVSKVLKVLPSDLYKSSFAKCFAYAIGWDIAHHEAGKVSVENKLREAIGGKTVAKSLIQDQWPTILGYVFLILQQDDPEDQWLQNRPGYAAASQALKQIKNYSYSTRALPPSQQPSIRSRFLPDQVERLSRRMNLQEPPWSASSFTLTVRMLLDAIDESLGSLHLCLMVRRIRTLVCLAGPVAFQSFALEMLIHSLRSLVEDSECADDAIGLLQYLFHHGEPYLKANPSFLGGTVMLLVLQMRKYSQEKQARSTQESQHTATVHKMESFLRWLVTYFKNAMPEKRGPEYAKLADAMGTLRLPGNALKGSPESSVLLFVIDQWVWEKKFCSRADAVEILQLLSQEFEAPPSVWSDCLGEDAAAVVYSQPLWEIMCAINLDRRFTAWAAQVLGRAYAATGARSARFKRQSGFARQQIEKTQGNNNIANSQAIIAEQWTDLLLSRSRVAAGLAEHSLRKFLMMENSDAEATAAFEQMLPEHLHEAASSGTFNYEPRLGGRSTVKIDGKALREAFECTFPEAVEDWAKTVATTVCHWAADMPLIANLALLVQHVDSLAVEILRSILHILLVKELEQNNTGLREVLSIAITACLSDRNPRYSSRQRFYLELLLYLRSQPYPGETTKVDRLQWLEVDYLLSADAGSRCGMATCALLLAESAAPIASAQPNRRSSTRNSLSQLSPAEPPEKLLLSIYQQLDEPDSFYGVPLPASLDSVLHRLDHEANGFRSLMFRSAKMDSHMRLSNNRSSEDAAGLMHSLSYLDFNSLTFSLLKQGFESSARTSQELISAAQVLQQWDISLPESLEQVSTFTVFQELSRASDMPQIKHRLQLAIVNHATCGLGKPQIGVPSHLWYSMLGSLTEVAEVVSSANQNELESRWRIMQARDDWMRMARYNEVKFALSSRNTLFGVLRQNSAIQKRLHINNKRCHALEAEALLHSSRLARGHSRLQDALTATTVLNDMTAYYGPLNLNVDAAVKFETACVLWEAGESTASVKMLQDTLGLPDVEKQDIPIGKAGLHAQLARQLAEARLEKPEEILSKYLRPAIGHLDGKKSKEAGKVYYEFASFCDNELSNPGNVEDLARITKLRQGKEEELDAINLAIRNVKKTGDDKHELQKAQTRAKTWLELDSDEEKRLKDDRTSFIHQSLQNYLLALQCTDEHDICVLRFFALWLENADDSHANAIVQQHLPDVPSWKFVLLMNQLMSRVEVSNSTFQAALKELLLRIFRNHPHQSIHHLYASSRPIGTDDPAAISRYNAARGLYNELRKDTRHRDLVDRIWKADHWYQDLAEINPELKPNTRKCRLKDIPEANRIASQVKELSLPPVTLSVPLRPSGDYRDIQTVKRIEDKVLIMNGISHPKVLTVLASNGQYHRQLFKGGNDDLRQDAIMEQVFEEVSKMLRNHKATGQRDLKVRTYKVIPLSTGSGIIEFVPNSVPINDFLGPAHKKYHPQDFDESKARGIIYNAQTNTLDHRLREYRRVCAHLHPVLRHFFFERFDDPDEWFERRTAYTRTTASISILGHILGLGDRHNSNILLDEKTGEIVHIDLGVAFEAGRVLPIPEKVPFRLTRDIVDGMGVTKTEGVFRRCCEFTLDAVREDKESIMTLLNVLRYDPLYSWSVSPLRAKRMQEAQELSRNAGIGELDSSKRREQEAGEADRALSIVEKKLSKTLSTEAAVNELIQQATDEKNLATLFQGWGAFW